MTNCCVVVVGHVDHGKTSLVHALTGMETDRLPEEKARGLSITTGFAHRSYPNGTLDFIDAPGHEDFVQAMVAGASGAQAALLVISARDGIAAQTREHLEIVGLLGITRGVIAVTKSDLLDPSEAEAKRHEVGQALADTSLATAPVILCSAQSGEGMEELDSALQQLLSNHSKQALPRTPFLPVDRVFSLAGHGTIITGTLLGTDLASDSETFLYPAGRIVALRSLQSRGVERNRVSAGERVAVNLRGIAVDDIRRGDVLSTKDAGQASTCFDVHIEMLKNLNTGIRHMEEVRVHFGSSCEVASVRLFGGGGIDPGKAGYAQLRFHKPVIGFEGQRAVLRRLSPAETIGGAVFLDVQATATRAGDKMRVQVLKAIRTHSVANIADVLCRAYGGVAETRRIARLARQDIARTREAMAAAFEPIDVDLISRRQDIDATKRALLDALATYHTKYPLRMMAARSEISLPHISSLLITHAESELAASGDIHRRDNRLGSRQHDPFDHLSDEQQANLDEIETNFRALGVTSQPSDPDISMPDLLALLIDAGRILPLRNVALKQTLYFHRDSINAAVANLQDVFALRTPFTTSQARTALATSRRIIVPLLEHFDSCGVTLREGDFRRLTGAIPVSPPTLPR